MRRAIFGKRIKQIMVILLVGLMMSGLFPSVISAEAVPEPASKFDKNGNTKYLHLGKQENFGTTGVPLSTMSKIEDDSHFESHLATKEDIEAMKARIGVRDPNKNYNVIVDGHGTGAAPPTEEEWNAMMGTMRIVDDVSISKTTLPTSVDHSQDPCFPPVGDQGEQGSCAAWATTYYINGYLQAKAHNWTDASTGNTDHLMSPAWTYNKVNGGTDSGSIFLKNWNIINGIGSATWSTMPYSESDYTSWGSEAAWRTAPEYRCTGYEQTNVSNTEVIKSLLNDGYVLYMGINAGQYSNCLGNGDDTITSAEYDFDAYPNHANTIVGYDDSKTADGETGAFKIVNSWGSDWGSEWGGYGYYWMTYDAVAELKDWCIVVFVASIWKINDTVSSEYYRLLATWNLDPVCARDAPVTIGVGPHGSPNDTRTWNNTWNNIYIGHYWDGGSYDFPSFMCLDITEFMPYLYPENTFFLEIGLGSSSGTIISFKVELYMGGYVPGSPTRVSCESLDTPMTTPGYVTVSMGISIGGIGLTPHTPISIASDTDFTVGSGVVGGTGTSNDPYIIEGWDINSNATHGIYIENTTAYFVIRSCHVYGRESNYKNGIYLYNVSNGVVDNVICDNNNRGIYIKYSSYNTIKNSVCYNNEGEGIGIYSSSNTQITNCVLHGNSCYGIEVGHSSNNTITKCRIYDIIPYGIILYNSSDNSITNCAVYDISQYGICIWYCSNNNISNNAIYNNRWSIYLENNAIDNLITYCDIVNNSDYGIYVYHNPDYPSNYNTIHHNNFISNGQNAYDPHTNYWDDGSSGNYWKDYTGADGNGDGIGDTAYSIPGGGVLDQQQVNADKSGDCDVFGSRYTAQTFTPTYSAKLSKIGLGYISTIGSPPNYEIQIRTTYSGIPTSTVLASTTQSLVSVSDEWSKNIVTFSSPPLLSAGVTYAIVVFAESNGVGSSNKVWWFGTMSSSYGNGTAYLSTDSGSTWSSPAVESGGFDSVSDFAFKTYFENRDKYPLMNPVSKTGLIPHAPICISDNSDFTPANGAFRGEGTENDPYIIENWDIDASSVSGIYIENTDVYFIIRNCMIHDGYDLDNCVISDGIGLYYVDNGKIENCELYNNADGIWLEESSNNNITNCTTYSNPWGGIWLYSSSNNNTVSNCNVYNSSGWYAYGIVLWGYSSNNTVSNCSVYNNEDCGIYLYYSPDNNTITKCTVYNNSDYGILLEASSNNNTITNCIIYNNPYGIYLSYSSGNLICNNYFNNTNNAYNPYGLVNYWDITKTAGTNIVGGQFLGGNYWGDYIGVDTDGDGLGDTPYSIPGGGQDDFPLIKGVTYTTGLIACWHFDENTDATVYDSLDNNNDGTIHGATWTSGVNGSALSFDGVDDYVEVVDDDSLDITDAITIEAWIYPKGWGEGSLGSIVDKNWLTGYAFYLKNTEGQESIKFASNNAGVVQTADSGSITLNAWQHVVVTYDRQNVVFYVNGINKGGGAATSALGTNSESLFIGSDMGTACTFNGTIDEIRIYNKALNATEIQAHYEEYASANNPPNIPSNPSPSNGATGQSITVDLSWTGGDPDSGDTVTYNVYFGTDSTPDSTELVSDDQSGTTYDPGTLSYNTHYYWKIIAKDNHDATTDGPVWDFTTTSATTPTITVTSPNGGESWQQGSTHTISWSSSGDIGSYVSIKLYKGGYYDSTIVSSTSNDGSYSWSILSSQTAGTDYKIKITSTSDTSVYDWSNEYFSIISAETPTITVTSPNGDESWQQGTTHTISWSSTGDVGSYVKIELYKGGTFDTTITSSTSNDGSYSWGILSSQTPGADHKVKITSTSDSNIYDYSDSYFSITSIAENHAPVVNSITANPTTVSTGETVTVSVDATDEDTDDVLTYYYDYVGDTISGNGSSITWTAPGTAGDYIITVYVNDGKVDSNSKSVIITVTQIVTESFEDPDTGTNVTAQYTGTGAINIASASSPGTPPSGMHGVNIFVNITVPETMTVEWMYIEIPYNESMLPAGVDESKLRLFYWTDTGWEKCENTNVDTTNNVVYANVTHLTIFAPMAEKSSEVVPATNWLLYVGPLFAFVIIIAVGVTVVLRKKKILQLGKAPTFVECPKCGEIIKVTSTVRSLEFSCPKCGVKGVLEE